MKYRNLFLYWLLSFVSCSPGSTTSETGKNQKEKRVEIYVGDALFTQFLYPDSVEKPVLFPIYDAGQIPVTRGFPRNPRPGEPTDHPHHLGCWFTFENVNGLDFWNNSYAIPAEKKTHIRLD